MPRPAQPPHKPCQGLTRNLGQHIDKLSGTVNASIELGGVVAGDRDAAIFTPEHNSHHEADFDEAHRDIKPVSICRNSAEEILHEIEYLTARLRAEVEFEKLRRKLQGHRSFAREELFGCCNGEMDAAWSDLESRTSPWSDLKSPTSEQWTRDSEWI